MLQIKQGQEYEKKGLVYEVVFVNEDVVLLQYGPNRNHRLEKRLYFERCVEAGEFESQQIVPEEDESESSSESAQEIPYEDIAWVGEKGAESLRSAGFVTVDNIERVSDERLLDCDNIGKTAVENIREWVKENE